MSDLAFVISRLPADTHGFKEDATTEELREEIMRRLGILPALSI
jgi:hypothetical protein